MRILYIPFVSNYYNIGGCSVYNTHKRMFRQLVDKYEDVFIYYYFPDHQEPEDYIIHPRIKLLSYSLVNDQYIESLKLPEKIERFSVLGGEYTVDLILNDKTRLTPLINALLNDPRHDRKIPIVNLNKLFTDTTTDRFKGMLPEFEFLMASGFLFGHTEFESIYLRNRSLGIMKRYFSPYQIMHAMKKFSNIGKGIDCDVLDKYFDMEKKKTEEMRCNYGQRLGTHYNFKDLFDEEDLLYRSGRKMKLVITTPSKSVGGSGGSAIASLTELGVDYELHTGLPQEEYYRVANTCQIFIVGIRDLEFPGSFLEQLYLGQIGVFPKCNWVDQIIPWYKYVYKNKAEFRTMIRYIADNYFSEEMQTFIQETRERIRKDFNLAGLTDRFYTYLKNLSDVEPPDSAVSLIKDALESLGYPSQITHSELRSHIKKTTKTSVDINGFTFSRVNKYDFYLAIRKNGYIDNCKSEEPIYDKI